MPVQSLLLPLLSGALFLVPTAAPPPPDEGAATQPAAAQESEATAAEAAAPVVVPGESLLLRGKRVIVRPGKVVEGAEVLVEGGKIVRVGRDLVAPEGARVLEGEVICAGFLDPWSSIGLEAGCVADMGTTPATATVDGLDPFDPSENRAAALRGGVVGARVQAGMAAPIGGVGAVVRTGGEEGGTVVLPDACLAASVGITRGGRPLDVFERLTEVERLVGLIERGRSYRESWVEYRHELEEWNKKIAEATEKLEKDFKKAKKKRDKDLKEAEEKGKKFKEEKYKEDKKPRLPKYDPDSEALARIAEGELPLVVEVHRVPEIRELLEKTARFDRLRLVLAGATEAAPLAEEIAARRIPVIVWPTPRVDSTRGELAAHDLSLAGKLAADGVKVLIGSGGEPHARDLRTLAALAVSHGLDPQDALAAITTNTVHALDVWDVLGTVERGKAAELVVLSGDPLDTTSRVQFVISQGRVVVE